MSLQGSAMETAGGYGPGGAPPGGMPPGGGYPPQGAPPGGGYPPQGGGPPGGGHPAGSPPGGYPAGGAPGMPPGAQHPGGGPTGKSKLSALAMISLAVLVLLVFVGGGLAIWFFVLGSSSVAHEHLPEGCEVVARGDLEGLRSVGPIEKHIMPALDEAIDESEDSAKIKKFFLSAGLDPRKDLKDVAICAKKITKGKPAVVLIVGGKIKENALIDAIQKHQDDLELEIDNTKEENGLEIIESDDGVFMTQASDGAFIASNDEDLLLEATETSAGHEAYDIPLDQQLVAIITQDGIESGSEQLKGAPFGEGFADAKGARVGVDLSAMKATVRIEMGDEDAADELASDLKKFKMMLDTMPSAMVSGEAKDMLEDAEIEADGAIVVVTLALPKKQFEEAMKEAAEGIEEAND